MEKVTSILSLVIMLFLALSLFSAVNVDVHSSSEITDSEIHQAEETDYILIEPEDDQEIEAGESINYTATAYNDEDEEIGNVTGETFWQIDEEAGGEWDQDTGTYTSEYAGDWTVTANYTSEDEEFEDDVALKVEEGPIDHIRVLPSEATLEAGEDIDYAAIAYDEYGNRIENVTDDTDWEIDDEAGGDWDDNEYTSENSGEWTVTGTYRLRGRIYTEDALLTVVHTDVDYVIIDPEEDQTVTVGEELGFTASAFDGYDNLITDDVTDFVWDNIQYIDEENNVAVFYQEEKGTYEITATYDGKDSEPTTVTVEAGEVAEVNIEPSEDQTVAAGETIDFSATAYDDEGNIVEDNDDEFTWEGTDDTGVFQETEAGGYDVTASYDGVTSEPVTVTVEAGEVAKVSIDPEEDQTIDVGEELGFTASAFDGYDNLITDDVTDFVWDNIQYIDEENNVAVFYQEEKGTYEVTATYDGENSEPTTVTVEAGEVAEVNIEPSENQTVTAGETIDFSATAYDEEGNIVEDDNNEFTWEGTDDTGVFQETEVGEYEVIASYEGVTSEPTTVTVEPGEVAKVNIDPEEDQTVTVGEELEFNASAYDEYGNLITDDVTEFEWENIDRVDEEENVAVFYQEDEGNYEVTATYDGDDSESTIVYVESSESESVEIHPLEDPVVEAGEELEFNASAYDEYGNLITDDVTEFEWENIDRVDEEENAAIFYQEEAGEYEVTATYGGIEDAITITVEASAPINIDIEPKDVAILAGDSLSYRATAYDQFGNDFGDVTAETTWSIDEGAGGEWDQEIGTYISEYAGEWTVTANYTYDEDELVDHVELTVIEAEPQRIEIEPKSSTISPGESQNYTATAYDEEGNYFDVTYNVKWSIEEGAGGSWSMNRYTSENPGTWDVHAEYSRDDIELTDNATLTVEEMTHTLTINHIGGGTTEPEEGDHVFQHGEEINLTAITTESWRFVEWTGDIEETSENVTVIIESDMEIFAIFEGRPYFEVEIVTPKEGENIEGNSITVRFNVTNRGIIEGSRNVTINIIGEDGNILYTHEETVTLEPKQRYQGEFTWNAPAKGNFVLHIDSGDTLSSLDMSVFESEESKFKIPTIWLFFSSVPVALILLIGWVHWKRS